MTDTAKTEQEISEHTSSAARLRLKKRYKSERMFKFWGQGAIFFSIGFLVLLLSTITFKALPAFTYHFASLPYDMSELDKTDISKLKKADYDGMVRSTIRSQFPNVSGRKDKKTLSSILSSGAPVILRQQVLKNPNNIDDPSSFAVPISDFADLYLKGQITNSTLEKRDELGQISILDKQVEISFEQNIFTNITNQIAKRLEKEALLMRESMQGSIRSLEKTKADIKIINEQLLGASEIETERLNKEKSRLLDKETELYVRIADLRSKANDLKTRAKLVISQGEEITNKDQSILIYFNGAVVKAQYVTPNRIIGKLLMPFDNGVPASVQKWQLRMIETPQANRKFSDQEIVWIDELLTKGFISKDFNWIFATKGASREPEMAGIWGAVVGSFLTIIVTLALAFPLGVAAAIYLEEFAPKNKITTIIEVNINNLAAVPSIVFGLLGLAVFLNFFGLDRSAPYVGGMVLALMTLPTIIIASRAALRAVPPSIREAALGIGASKLQTVLHHVLPLAMPGIMTGTIIGLAQALGETAPLLMIGMVAFVVDIPGALNDPATVLPVQIFMWADFPEPAFEQRTSAAILVLLAFLILMNALAVIIRKRFERRW